MNKVYRKGVDIGVALSLGAKRQLSKIPMSAEVSASLPESGHPVEQSPEGTPISQSLKGAPVSIKAIVRPIARFAYRCLKPLLRPVIFRLRRYFTEGLRQDMIQELHRVSAETLPAVQAMRESLGQELVGIHSLISALSLQLDRIGQYSGISAHSVAVNCGSMKNGVVVIGAGGHAKVCIELLQAMGEEVAYCIGADDSAALCAGIPVLRGDENLLRLRKDGYARLFVAIGSNSLRARLATLAVEHGYQLVNAISPHAIISPTVQLGSGIAVMAGVVINAEAAIGDLAIINTGAIIDHNCQIGAAVHIGPLCGLAGNVRVGRQSFLGIGCKVIPEISIGDDVIIGAGSVVIRTITSNVKAVGTPARVMQVH